MSEIKKFRNERKKYIKDLGQNKKLKALALRIMGRSLPYKYSYNFDWLGVPIIQYPQDIVAVQEIIWKVKPDFIIETGIARGGSLIFYASMLELLGKGKVLGIDIDIRSHNRKEIEKHKMSHHVKMIQGSSVDDSVIKNIKKIVKKHKKIMVLLDSNHAHGHVLKELELYSPLVSKGSYLVVFDTVIEDLPRSKNRLWGKGNSPKTAVREFLKKNKNFIIDKEIENKLLITVAPSGYLKRVS